MDKSATIWLKKAYPISSKDLVDSGASDLELVDHSINKWEHLRPEILREHGIEKELCSWDLIDESGAKVLTVNASSCALCEAYADNDFDCPNCPLAQVRGGVRCDDKKLGERYGRSPWGGWDCLGDPEPMIYWLKKARELVMDEQGRENSDN